MPSKWDEDYKESDDYLGYGEEDARQKFRSADLQSDPYATGGSNRNLVEKLLPPSLRKYAHLAVSGVRKHLGWLDADCRRDALNVAAAILIKASEKRQPQYNEAQFCAYLKKSISGELLKSYDAEIAHHSGYPDTPSKIGTASRKPVRSRAEHRQDELDREAYLREQRESNGPDKRGCRAKGLLPDRHYQVWQRREDGETLQSIATDFHVTPQRVREIQLRAEAILNEKIAKLDAGEKIQTLIRQTVEEDPARSGLDPYDIDNLVRERINLNMSEFAFTKCDRPEIEPGDAQSATSVDVSPDDDADGEDEYDPYYDDYDEDDYWRQPSDAELLEDLR